VNIEAADDIYGFFYRADGKLLRTSLPFYIGRVIGMAGALLVRDIMTKTLRTVRPNSSVLDAVQKMNKFNIGSILVVDGRRPVGIVTERDILRRVVELSMEPSIVKVSDIMSHPVVTINPDATIEEAARLMTAKQIKKLPVVQEDGVVGIITTMDIMKAAPRMMDLFGELSQTRRP